MIYQQFSGIIVIVIMINIVFIFGKEESCMARRKKKTDCVRIAYKYRAYPDENQQILFQKTFGCCRKVYNLMLADKIEYYHQMKKMLKVTPAQYKDTYPFLREVDSLALANVQRNLETAYERFFDKVSKFPKFKSKKTARKSYTTNVVNNNIVLNEHSIRLPKVGQVRIKVHRKPEDCWNLKSVTVSQECDNTFYVSVLFEYPKPVIPKVQVPKTRIGLDYKSDGLYMDSNHQIGTNHKYFRESQQKLAKRQRQLRHKQCGSNNYQKQQLQINKVHRKIARQRLDNHHKLSTEIANQYDLVCVETLNMKALSNQKFHNGKATMDNGYGQFLNLLEYKLMNRGKLFIKVDKWFPSSQLCSSCGHRQKLELSERIYECPQCGLHIDRDYNAALNILQEGLRLFAEA